MKMLIEFTFDENEWSDYSDVIPELVFEDFFGDIFEDSGVSATIIKSEGFAEEQNHG